MTDIDLNSAILNLTNSKSAPNIGKFLNKIRVAREGGGKSGGYRTIIVFKINDIALFSYGLGKSEKDNLNSKELKYWKKFAKNICVLNSDEIKKAIATGTFIELEEIKNA